ncbi:hypothetical protein D8674_024476 [Pyrus ussuriensis x Pyrus communis]|uniref:Uncharacterized protein n=1 Tax=Pyrus ussuriensis x Pyrus communis TaxID=2448454 RepID=A0A5N5HGJ5_9ROSA|nr:hypothetical protein D8674_024476 [Pyrus ussuriensis x Pyrus communis]
MTLPTTFRCRRKPPTSQSSPPPKPPSPSNCHQPSTPPLRLPRKSPLPRLHRPRLLPINHHPPIISFPLSHIKPTVHFLLTSINFISLEFRRLIGMCLEIVSSHIVEIVPLFVFLLRQAHVNGSDLRRIINRRSRLLACSVKTYLRPNFYFLQSINISQVNKHTSLISYSMEDKLLPQIDYLEKIGFSYRNAMSMFQRFPQLFCYRTKKKKKKKWRFDGILGFDICNGILGFEILGMQVAQRKREEREVRERVVEEGWGRWWERFLGFGILGMQRRERQERKERGESHNLI